MNAVARIDAWKQWLKWPLLFLAVGSLIASLAYQRHPVIPEPPPVDREVFDFAFTERSGQTITKKDLDGKVWITSFVFTTCTGPCPTVTANFARLQAELDLANEPNLRLVTFSVDPERDTLDVLTKYASTYRAHKDRWLFLTARKEEEMQVFARNNFFLLVERSKVEKPPVGEEFDHSTKLAVIDKRGHVRGHFEGWCSPLAQKTDNCATFEASFAQLKQLVAQLLKE